MATFNARKGNTSGVPLSQTAIGGTYTLRNNISLASKSSGGVLAANDIIQALDIPAECVLHWVGARTNTVNTSAGSVQISGNGFIYVAAANGNLSAQSGSAGFATSAAIFPYFNSAASVVEVVLTSGTISAADGNITVYAVVTPGRAI